jgi:hypothetical protein
MYQYRCNVNGTHSLFSPDHLKFTAFSGSGGKEAHLTFWFICNKKEKNNYQRCLEYFEIYLMAKLN